jgi:hypothetical protein
MVGKNSSKGVNIPWVGVDLDGTLAEYHGEFDDNYLVGDPIWPMVNKVKELIDSGMMVKIFTARMCHVECRELIVKNIQEWCGKCGLPSDIEVTNVKDYGMVELWDDRCRQVVFNKGEFVISSNKE